MSTIYVLIAPTVLLLALLAMLVVVSRRHRRILPKLPTDRRRRTANAKLHTLQESGRYWGVRIDSHCRATSPLVGREYAFDSAPHLPYQGCNAAVCSCSYVGLADRRSIIDRRTGEDRRSSTRLESDDRRAQRPRRETELNPWLVYGGLSTDS